MCTVSSGIQIARKYFREASCWVRSREFVAVAFGGKACCSGKGKFVSILIGCPIVFEVSISTGKVLVIGT